MDDESTHKRKKRKVDRESSYKHVVKLLVLSASGEHKKVKKLLQRHDDLDVNSYNSEGFTPLHQVSMANLVAASVKPEHLERMESLQCLIELIEVMLSKYLSR